MADEFRHLLQKRDRLKQLRSFCQTARLGSITRAAPRVMSSQPAVSMQIRALEEELGVPLFDRRGPRISLSPIGRRLYRFAMPLVHKVDRLPDIFAEEHFGVATDHLRIGAGQVSAAYLLPDYLKEFQARYPETRIEVNTGSGRRRLSWLLDHEMDLVVAAMDSASPDVEFHPIRDSRSVLVTPEDHPLAGRESVTIEEAAAWPLVGHRAGNYVRQVADTVARMRRLAPDYVVEVDGWGVIVNYVMAGVGIAVVPDLCLTGKDRVWRIPFDGIVPPRRYGAITRRDGPLSLAASRFLEIVVANRRRPSGGP